MRTKLGLAIATVTAASILAVGSPTGATPPTTQDTTTTTVEVTTTTTTTTTTTVPPVIDGPIGEPAPSNRGTQVQINPPPATTTTTLPPGPDFSVPGNSGSGRRVIYSKARQLVWVIESNGQQARSPYFVSGKQSWCDPTPGSYQVYSRSRYTFSINNPSIIWGYMVRFAKGCQGGNIGFHEIPTNANTGYKVQSVSQLGQPLSGGCVRQAVSDAIWMWNWAYVGTQVVVLP